MTTLLFFVAVLFAVMVWFGFTALLAVIFAALWNITLPPLFGWPIVTFWQAFALVVLISIIGGLLSRK